MTLDIDAPDGLPKARADSELLRRILVNIIGNAIKFSPEGGAIRVSVRAEHRSVRVMVTDQGPGIPAEYHDKIFDKFGQVESRQTGRKYSTGLGLAFCKMAVEAQGGRIGLDSEIGAGSTFWFTLPIA